MKTSGDKDEQNIVMEFDESGKLKNSLLDILNLNTGNDGKKWDKVILVIDIYDGPQFSLNQI